MSNANANADTNANADADAGVTALWYRRAKNGMPIEVIECTRQIIETVSCHFEKGNFFKKANGKDSSYFMCPISENPTFTLLRPGWCHNKKPKGNDRSPESQQVQSLDKVVGIFFYHIWV